MDGEPAGCLEPLQAASPAAPTVLAPAASCPNERRDIPLMRPGLLGIRHGVNGGGRVSVEHRPSNDVRAASELLP